MSERTMAGKVPENGGETPRARMWMPPVVAVLVAFSLFFALGAFDKSLHETSGFESANTGISEQRIVNLFVEGELKEFDSAGIHVERRGNPYRAHVSVSGPRGWEVREFGLALAPRRGGPTIVAEMHPVELLGDSTYVQAFSVNGISLAHEEHVATVTVRVGTGVGDHTDTVRLPLRPTFTSTRYSFRDWLSRL